MITNRRNKECITFHLSYSYLVVQGLQDFYLRSNSLRSNERKSFYP